MVAYGSSKTPFLVERPGVFYSPIKMFGHRSILRVVKLPGNIRGFIPAVVHVDGSARVQTVDKREIPGYWKLINTVYKITDVPLVLNTSFNVAGNPIVETPQDAVDCFESTDIDVLLLEDWVISKRPIEEFEKISR